MNKESHLIGRLGEIALVLRCTSVVYYNNIIKAFGKESVYDTAQLFIGIKRRNYNRSVKSYVFLIHYSFLPFTDITSKNRAKIRGTPYR